jgi:hypothetical protein
MIPASQPATSRPPKGRHDGDDEARGDLDDADEVHRGTGAAGEDVVELGGEVARPVVSKDVGELVEAHDDGEHGETDAQRQEGLRGGIGAQDLALRDRDRPECGGDGTAHVNPLGENADGRSA